MYHRGRLHDAISHLTVLGRRFPASAKLWGYLGFLNKEAGRLPTARRCFQKTVDLSPKSERASLGLFFVLWRLGEFADALKEMGRFALNGKPVQYLSLLRGEFPAEPFDNVVPTLLDEELREVEAAYLEAQQRPRESITEVAGIPALRELVNA